MPTNEDFLRLTLIHQISGVTMRNDVYFQAVQIGTVTTLDEVGALLLSDWKTKTLSILTDQVFYIAALVDNITRNEIRGIVTDTAAGSVADDSHPQDQVVRFNEYGQDTPVDPQIRNAFNLSGVAEQFSTSGRLNDLSMFTDVEAFLADQFFDAVSGFTANPQVRELIPATSPPVYNYFRATRAIANPTLFKLKSRKTSFLG